MNKSKKKKLTTLRKTRVLLIYPRGGDVRQGMPLAFGYFKSNTDDSKYDLKIINLTLDEIDPSSPDFVNKIKKISPQIVGVSSWSVNFSEALTIFKIAKSLIKNVTTIFGGPHATVYANKVIKNKEIDFVFRGEAELSFPRFLDELQNKNHDFSKIKGLVYKTKEGKIIFNEISRIENLDDIKIPDYNFINIDKHIKNGYNYQGTQKRNAPILATRGCPYRCAFCAVPSVSGGKIRKHSTGYLIQWIKLLYQKHKIRGFNIIDDNFTFDIDYAKEFCKEVIKLGYKDIEFNSPNGVRMQRGDYELWSLMKKAGWRTVVVAPESGSEKELKIMNKNLDIKKVPGYIEDIKKAGLKVVGFFMMGYPGETKNDIKKTELLIKKCKFSDIAVSMFQPMPGTPIYDKLVVEGFIADNYLPANFGNVKINTYISSTLKDFDFGNFRERMIMITFLNSPMTIVRRYFTKIKSNPSSLFSIILEIIKEIPKPAKYLKSLYLKSK